MSKKFLTEQTKDILEYGVQIREDEPDRAIELSGGTNHSLALKANGEVWAWGRNNHGQLGNNFTTQSLVPVKVVNQSDFVAISTGDFHSLALKANGEVWTWGRNNYGQLGNNSTTQSLVPVKVLNQSDFVAISGGTNHSLALKANGEVWSWGRNNHGQLGDNTIVDKSVPVKVLNQSDFVAIATGAEHSLALKSNGEVWAWGYNLYGQLGDGTSSIFENKSAPTLVVNQSDFVAIAAGNDHSLALKANGEVWAWGSGGGGRLGNNSTTGSSVPVKVVNQSDFVAIAGGSFHSLALKSNGEVWAWGGNGSGQLGNNSTTGSSVPVKVVNQSDFVAIAGGSFHSLALKANGEVWAWGSNDDGQLGDGTASLTIGKSVPVLTESSNLVRNIVQNQAYYQKDIKQLKVNNYIIAETNRALQLDLNTNTIPLKNGDIFNLDASTLSSFERVNRSTVFNGSFYAENSYTQTTSSLSVSMWIKFDDTITDQNIFSYPKNTADSFRLSYSSTELILTKNTQTANYTYTLDNLWHHLAATYDQTNGLKLYLDGELVASGVADGALSASGLFSVGTTNGTNGFTGSLANIQVWSKELDGEPFLLYKRGYTEDQSFVTAFSNLETNCSMGDGNKYLLGLSDQKDKKTSITIKNSTKTPVIVGFPDIPGLILPSPGNLDNIASILNSNQTRITDISLNQAVLSISKNDFTSANLVELLDQTGNGNDLSFTGLPVYSLDIPTDPGLTLSSVFDNTTYLTTNFSETYNPSFSFSAWIKFDPSDTTQQVFKVGNFEMYINGTDIVLKKGTLISSTATFDLSNPANQGWNHFVATWYYNGPATGSMYLYRNGTQIIGTTSQNDDGGFGNAITGAFDLGANTGDANYRFLGKISNVEIWSTQLGLTDAANLHAAGYYTNPSSIVVSGLTHHYLMGDGLIDVYDIIKDVEGSADFQSVSGLLTFDKNDLP